MTQFGCPVCGFTSDNEDKVREHMIEKADDPAHHEYDAQQNDDEEEV
jgi:hypothetical protein